MRTRTISAALFLLAVGLAAYARPAGAMDGTLKLGGVIVDETGDRTTVQEMYNVYDGFNVTQIRLDGMMGSRNYLRLNLQDLSLDSRKGEFLYRLPGIVKLTAAYDQHRQIFSPDGGVDSRRRDWQAGLQLTPLRRFSLSGDFNYQTRDGDRLSFPAGTAASALGTSYDNVLWNAGLTANFRDQRMGGAVSYRISEFDDRLNRAADRTGYVWSGRLYAPMPFYDKWTNLVRGAIGARRLSGSSLRHRLASVQYTGVFRPITAFQFNYNFDASRIEDDATQLRTDRFQNNFDATYFHRYFALRGGYGYETNDDDRRLTSYNSWRAGGDFHYRGYVTARVDYANRAKKDLEELTLLKDVEANQIRAKLEVRPIEDLTLGGDYAKREREFPDISVTADGEAAGAFGRYALGNWGAISGDYHYTNEEYLDLAGRFRSNSNIVTGRLEFTRVKGLRLAGGATYLDIGKDLDIEKSMVFVEGRYRFPGGYHLEVLYNVYNYDDYILLDRYYTANVVRINLGYDLHL